MIIAALLMAQAAIAAPIEAVRVPFSPPLNRPVIEENVQTRELDNGDQGRFVIRREYRFSRDGEGYLVVMRATEIDSSQAGPARRGFEIGSRPMLGLPLEVRLDRDGRVVEVQNADAYWEAFTAGQMALRRELEDREGLTSTDRRVIAAVVDALLAMPPTTREAQLRGDVSELTALAGRTLSTQVPITFEPEGNRAGGTLQVASITADAVELTLAATTGPGTGLAQIHTDARIILDRGTGLVRSRVQNRVTRQEDHVSRATDERRLIFP